MPDYLPLTNPQKPAAGPVWTGWTSVEAAELAVLSVVRSGETALAFTSDRQIIDPVRRCTPQLQQCLNLHRVCVWWPWRPIVPARQAAGRHVAAGAVLRCGLPARSAHAAGKPRRRPDWVRRRTAAAY